MTSTSPLRISVALASYQGAEFILEQIESILQQNRTVNEVVVSDDASTDGTLDIVRAAFAARSAQGLATPELIILQNTAPLRVTQNFSQAIAHTTGDLVALCDQDDVWHPERIRVLEEAFKDSEALLVMSNARQVDAAGQSLGHSLFEALRMTDSERSLMASGNAYRQFLRRNLATGATVMFRRELAERAMPFPDSWVHDEWLAIVAAASGGVRLCDAQLTDYRQHGNNQIGMEKLGFRRMLGMLFEPRTARNLRLFYRAEALAQRITELPVSSQEYITLAQEKLDFELARQAYPVRRISRIKPILRQWKLGNYASYGTGLKDAVRNFTQPV